MNSSYIYIYISAVKRLIAINRIQNKFFYIVCVCTVYIYYVYINTHTCMFIFKKNMLRLYIKYIYTLYQLYKYIHLNTCKYFQNRCCMCVCLYIHNKYTQYTHMFCKQKLIFWMRLIMINHLTALIHFYISIDIFPILYDIDIYYDICLPSVGK